MAKQDPEFWEKASNARDALSESLEVNEAVGFVDIGYREGVADAVTASVRIHVWSSGDECAFPQEIDGIPVVISSDSDNS